MNILKAILDASIIKPDEALRGDVNGNIIKATLTGNGKICIDGKNYSNVDEAMQAVIPTTQTSSSGLQFWSWFNAERNAWTPLEHARAELASKQQSQSVKTSDSHPLRIDYVRPSKDSGRIGMTICPGKKGSGLYGGNWQRDLETDLQQIRDWGSDTLITLMESHEFKLLGIEAFEDVLSRSHLNWLHLPIQDMHAPDDTFEQAWDHAGQHIRELLKQGTDIVIHCRGGLGRTGLLAARILVEMGEGPEASVKRVRAARERAIETYAQEQYVLNQTWDR